MVSNVYECDKCGFVYYMSGKSAKCPRCKDDNIAIVAEVGDI